MTSFISSNTENPVYNLVQSINFTNTNKYVYENNENHYDLKKNEFDPFKGSPPKTFMIKLHMRMKNYNLSSLGINDISRNSE